MKKICNDFRFLLFRISTRTPRQKVVLKLAFCVISVFFAISYIYFEIYLKVNNNPVINEDIGFLHRTIEVFEEIEPQSIFLGEFEAKKLPFTSFEFDIKSGYSTNFNIQLVDTKHHVVYYDRTITDTDIVESPVPQSSRVVIDTSKALVLESGYFPIYKYEIYITNNDPVKPLYIEMLEDEFGNRTPNIRLRRLTLNGQRLVLFVYLILFVVFGLTTILIHDKFLKPEKFFLFAGIPLAVGYFLIFPTFNVEDAYYHYAAGYHYSSVLLGAEGNASWEGRGTDIDYYRENAAEKFLFTSMHSYVVEISNAFRKGGIDHYGALFHPYKSTTSYSAVSYFPQILGFATGRMLRLNGFMTARVARLFMMIVYLFAFYHAIQIVPIGKSVFTLCGLLPRVLFTCVSLSYDAMIIVVSFLFFANILRLKVDLRSRKAIIETLFIAILLGAVKGGALLILLPIVLILWDTRQKNSFLIIVGIIGIAALSFIAFNPVLLSGSHFQLRSDAVDRYTTSFALVHPLEYLRMVWNTYQQWGGTQLIADAMGSVLAGLYGVVPRRIIFLLLILQIAGSLTEYDSLRIHRSIRLIFITAITLILVLTPAMMLKDTPIPSKTVARLQGRYYFNIIPLFLILIKRSEHNPAFANFRLRFFPNLERFLYKTFLIVSFISMTVMFRGFLIR